MINFYTYAIGDVHGRYDLLIAALRAINADLCRRAVPGRIVLLGDYIDRGPRSRDVVDALSRSSKLVCLKGNHEEMMTAALVDVSRSARRVWLSYGGKDTLRSYGGKTPVPQSHLAWLVALPLMLEDRHRIYVHAGLEPGVRLADQRPASMLWIRESFLRAEASRFPDGKHVVHGHTPEWDGKLQPSAPELLPHRTNLDTGAYMTDVLTTALFDDALPGGPIRLLTTTPQGSVWSAVGPPAPSGASS